MAVALAVGAAAIVPGVALGVPGDFAQPSTSPEPTLGSGATSLTAANFGGTSATDIAVASIGDDTVRVMMGDGTGDFTHAASSPEAVGGGPGGVVAANLDGDAHTDLAVANFDDGTVSILLGDGTGNFTAAGTPEDVGDGPLGIIAANLNTDTDVDLATANVNGSSVSILLGDGEGDFAAATTETAASNPRYLAAANLNTDTDTVTDLAVATRDSDNVQVLLGDGAGDFTAAAGTSPETVGDAPVGIVATNLGGDANVDIATANRDSDDLTVLIGDGSGDFTAAGTSPEPAGDGANWLAAANLGGDASTDLAVANVNTTTVSVLLGSANGNFTATASSPVSVGSGPRAVVAAQLGGDANLDLATSNTFSDNVSILLNNFAPPPTGGGGGNPGTTPQPATTICKKKKKKKTKRAAPAAGCTKKKKKKKKK